MGNENKILDILKEKIYSRNELQDIANKCDILINEIDRKQKIQELEQEIEKLKSGCPIQKNEMEEEDNYLNR